MIYNYLQRFDAGTDDANMSSNMIYNSQYGSDPNMDSDVANSNVYLDIAQYDQLNQNQARMQAEQEAESANSIQKYNMMFQQLMDQNNKLKQQNLDIKTNAVKQNPYYKIGRGDTLSKIAAKHNITVEELAKLNGIKNINDIKLGQHLRFSNNVSNRYTNRVYRPQQQAVQTQSKNKTTMLPEVTVKAPNRSWTINRHTKLENQLQANSIFDKSGYTRRDLQYIGQNKNNNNIYKIKHGDNAGKHIVYSGSNNGPYKYKMI